MQRKTALFARVGACTAMVLAIMSCATSGDPWTQTETRTREEAARAQQGRLCPIEIENATDGILEMYYSAGPERARKLDRVGTGARVAVAVPCEARYVSVSALGPGGRYAKRAELKLLEVTEVRINSADLKR